LVWHNGLNNRPNYGSKKLIPILKENNIPIVGGTFSTGSGLSKAESLLRDVHAIATAVRPPLFRLIQEASDSSVNTTRKTEIFIGLNKFRRLDNFRRSEPADENYVNFRRPVADRRKLPSLRPVGTRSRQTPHVHITLTFSLVPRSAAAAAPPDVAACGTCHLLLLRTSPRFRHLSSPPSDIGTSVLHRPGRLGRAPPPARPPRAATTPSVSAPPPRPWCHPTAASSSAPRPTPVILLRVPTPALLCPDAGHRTPLHSRPPPPQRPQGMLLHSRN
jgi:hypothetical protein